MKFSELSTDRAADVLCEVSVYALNILTDDELRESLKAQIDAEKPQTAIFSGITPNSSACSRMNFMAPHRSSRGPGNTASSPSR